MDHSSYICGETGSLYLLLSKIITKTEIYANQCQQESLEKPDIQMFDQ
jgi:hypothetical protein